MPETSNSPSLPGGACGFPSFSETQASARALVNRLGNLVVMVAVMLLAQFSYDVAAAGRRTALEETLNGSQSISQWTYGRLSQLKSETVQAAPPSSALVTGSLTYVHDPLGNRTDRTGMLGAATAQTQQLDQHDPLDDGDDPAAFTSGSEVNGNTPHAAGKTYEYDPENRLIGINGGQVQMAYDGDGHRVRKTSPAAGGGSKTTYYLVDDLNPTGYAQVLEEWEATGTEPPRLVRRYTHGLNLISVRDSSESYPEPTTHYYGHDAHGSVRFLTGETGPAVTDTYTYDAYGVLLDQTPSDATARTPNNYLYVGEQWDPDLDLYYNRARYLDPNLGRFWTMDTFEGNQSDPRSLHKYLYAHGNPISLTDPSGQSVIGDFLLSIQIRFYLFAISTAPVATFAKAGLANLTFATAIHDPGTFVSALESPAVAASVLAADVAFVAYYGKRSAQFVSGYIAARTEVQPAVQEVLGTAVQRIQELDRNAVVGFRGSVARGYKGPHKDNDPFDPGSFDVDGFIVSNDLAARIPKSGPGRFVTRETSKELTEVQEAVDQQLRVKLTGLKNTPFTFRVFTFEEYLKKPKDMRFVGGE